MTAAACAAAAADGVSAVDRELRAALAFELPARGDGNTVAVLLGVGDRGAPADGLNAAPLAADEGRSRPGDDKRAR